MNLDRDGKPIAEAKIVKIYTDDVNPYYLIELKSGRQKDTTGERLAPLSDDDNQSELQTEHEIKILADEVCSIYFCLLLLLVDLVNFKVKRCESNIEALEREVNACWDGSTTHLKHQFEVNVVVIFAVLLTECSNSTSTILNFASYAIIEVQEVKLTRVLVTLQSHDQNQRARKLVLKISKLTTSRRMISLILCCRLQTCVHWVRKLQIFGPKLKFEYASCVISAHIN